MKASALSFDLFGHRKQVNMYGWWFISTLLSLNVICHANPANNMVIGYNCTGFSTASRIFGVVESMEAIAINNRPWWNIFSLFNSKPNTILDTVRTYPPVNDPIVATAHLCLIWTVLFFRLDSKRKLHYNLRPCTRSYGYRYTRPKNRRRNWWTFHFHSLGFDAEQRIIVQHYIGWIL